MAPANNRRPTLLSGVPVASFWIDESGSKATASKCFVVAGLKTRHPDDLQREVHAVRQQTGFENELKFGRVTRHSYEAMIKVIDVLEQSDARIVATVVDSAFNPFHGCEVWQGHAHVISQLIVGNINKNEVATAFLDGITTPAGKSLGTAVRRSVNSRLSGSPLVSAVSLNSKTNDLLQVADLIAGAIRYRRLPAQATSNAEKHQIAARLAAAFRMDSFDDQRSDRVNIGHLKGPGAAGLRRGHLKVIPPNETAS